MLYKVEQIASSDTTVLILGETGTGKSWVASCIATAAIRAGHKTRYFKVSDLLYSLSMTLEDGV